MPAPRLLVFIKVVLVGQILTGDRNTPQETEVGRKKLEL